MPADRIGMRDAREIIRLKFRLVDARDRPPARHGPLDGARDAAAGSGRVSGQRALPKRRPVRPSCLHRDPAHCERDRQRSRTKQRHEPERSWAERSTSRDAGRTLRVSLWRSSYR